MHVTRGERRSCHFDSLRCLFEPAPWKKTQGESSHLTLLDTFEKDWVVDFPSGGVDFCHADDPHTFFRLFPPTVVFPPGDEGLIYFHNPPLAAKHEVWVADFVFETRSDAVFDHVQILCDCVLLRSTQTSDRFDGHAEDIASQDEHEERDVLDFVQVENRGR